jgi:hypothetical protein
MGGAEPEPTLKVILDCVIEMGSQEFMDKTTDSCSNIQRVAEDVATVGFFTGLRE